MNIFGMVIGNVDAAIEAVGGNKAAAKIAGVGTSAVCNWRKINRLPPHLYLAFKNALNGHEISETLFASVSMARRRKLYRKPKQ